MPTGHTPQSLEADPYTDPTTWVSEKPNAGHPLYPLQLNEPSYVVISTVHSAVLQGYIIAGNCLWRFSLVKDLTRWEKRAFNAVALLLSTALGFGIGFLFDKIGLLARGALLQSQPHSVVEVYTPFNGR